MIITLKSHNRSRLGTVKISVLSIDYPETSCPVHVPVPLDIFPPCFCFLLCYALVGNPRKANASQTLRVSLVPDSKWTIWLCIGGHNTI